MAVAQYAGVTLLCRRCGAAAPHQAAPYVDRVDFTCGRCSLVTSLTHDQAEGLMRPPPAATGVATTVVPSGTGRRWLRTGIIAAVGALLVAAMALVVVPALRRQPGADGATPGRRVKLPATLGGFDLLEGPDIDRQRAATLRQMATPAGAQVLVGYYGDQRPRFIVQALNGDFPVADDLLDNEIRALTAGGAGSLTGPQTEDRNGVHMDCASYAVSGDAASGNEISMCLYARTGFVVVGSGVNLDIDATAKITAEAVRRL